MDSPWASRIGRSRSISRPVMRANSAPRSSVTRGSVRVDRSYADAYSKHVHTNRSETRQISIEAAPDQVLDVVGDARTLPRWAPKFATTIRPDGEHWVVNEELTVDVHVDRAHGTVDIVSPADPRLGAFTRVVPNGAGSEYLFTLFFPEAAGEDAIATQMAVVEEELCAMRALAQPGARGCQLTG